MSNRQAADVGRAERVSIAGLVSVAGWVVFALALVGFAGQRAWPFELSIHFWPQMALTLGVSAAASALAKSKPSAITQACAAALLSALVAAEIGLPPAGPADGEPSLVVMFANVEGSNDDAASFIELVREVGPDVIGIAEVDRQWEDDMEDLSREYAYRISVPRPDNFGIALLSRYALTADSVELLGPARLPSIFATVEEGDRRWRIIVTHATPPFTPFHFDGRNEQLTAIAEHVAADTTPAILIGDLNATIWSPYARDLRRDAGLESAAGGLRALYTWPTRSPLLALGIDHCMHTTSVQPTGYSVLHDIGSDHFPLVCSFRPASPS